jgi:hypothetical protein
LESVEPRRRGVTLEPRQLTYEVREGIAVKSDGARQRGRSARPRPPSSLSATSVVEDRSDVLFAGLVHIACFDLVPGGPRLGPLPLLNRAQLGSILELAEMLIDEDPRGGRNLETAALRMDGKSPALLRGELDAQWTNSRWRSGFHYHAYISRQVLARGQPGSGLVAGGIAGRRSGARSETVRAMC